MSERDKLDFFNKVRYNLSKEEQEQLAHVLKTCGSTGISRHVYNELPWAVSCLLSNFISSNSGRFKKTEE